MASAILAEHKKKDEPSKKLHHRKAHHKCVWYNFQCRYLLPPKAGVKVGLQDGHLLCVVA